ncbi:biorientation of chromosomes in cell division protein 1-like 1 [Plodia interpunctella]|uniref:biorientation of chromosomes in cell division protein 1-like 1 n=1 Tax=Plodia interpunctella TaxID=58824 RepID=UPI002367FFD0|nr:biorientation of chromosomes in cell division protein 1-like 1 [Plodia interpunctella]
MTHMQYLPGDPRVVDQLVYELKSRGIFDQFRKECISDVDTRPAYQNLRQRVETSVATFLARQVWKPDLNKNQLREKLRKHILDGNYLEQGVERIVDQVVNPKVASVFIPQVEDLVYDFFGIPKKKSTPTPETSNGKLNENDLLPTDLEAVSPGSVKSHDDKTEIMDTDEVNDKMEVDDDEKKIQAKEENSEADTDKVELQDTNMSIASEFASNDSNSIDKIAIPLPSEEIKIENIPPPDNSPPKAPKVELDGIELPKEPIASTDIPLPDEIPNPDKEHFFKPINANSDDDSSSDSSLRRNMSPITPIRNFNNENSCDAQQAFEDENTEKTDEIKEPSTFRFTIENKSPKDNVDESKEKKVDPEQTALSYQFNNQVNINNFNTPLYDDSSNSNLLHIDYESDANSKTNNHENKVPEVENSEESKKEKKTDDKKSSHRASHHSRDSNRHSSSKDRRSDSKHSTSRDNSRHDRKTSSKDDHKSKSSSKDESKDKSDKKENRDSRESSKHRSSHKSSSSSHRDSKSHKSSSSSSSQRHSSSSKHSDEKKSSSSSSHKEKSERSSDKSKDSKEKSSRDSKSSSHRSDKDRKSSRESSKSKHEDKDKKKEKKETDDHYSVSGRGNNNRRSTDRDSNDGSSSSKGSNHPSSSKSSESKKDSKTTSKSDTTSTSSDSTSPSDKELVLNGVESENKKDVKQSKVVRVDTHLEVPISAPPRLPFVPDVTLKKPKFAENMHQARKLMKMRKFLDEEQKRMNQEAALLLEFQANVRPSLSQVYSSIPGPELEFACITNAVKMVVGENYSESENEQRNLQNGEVSDPARDTRNDALIEILTAAQQVDNNEETSTLQLERDLTGSNDVKQEEIDTDKKAKVQQPETVEKITTPESAKMEIRPDVNDQFHLDEVKIGDYKVSEINEIIGVPDASNTYDYTDNTEENQNTIVEEKPITHDNLDKDEYNKDTKKPPEYFEVTVITEELSETEETDKCKNIHEEIRKHALLECRDENLLEYFGEGEKYNAEIERDRFSKFLNNFTDKVDRSKMYLVNCDTYEENLIKEVASNHGDYEIVNYYKNGHFKLCKNVVKDLNISDEVALPVDSDFERPPIFSPVKSECSFELTSDYDAKLEEMAKKTSRQEIMEIILGSAVDESPNKMPKIDYCMESSIVNEDNSLKRKLDLEVECLVNNNRPVLTPNKIRKFSGSDQITSTTEENEERSNNSMTASVRSKYLGRAKRVGLPRPKRTTLPNSPSSDKSVENYEQNRPTPNGKLKSPAPRKVQRYDTSDLYKPKLHYLSRRNNIS